jgi:outer membrane immunogenic protein
MKHLLATASFLVLGSASVLAADLPVKYKPAPFIAAPVFSWTGCYVGVHGGGGAMRDNNTETNGTGGIAGGQVGCNYQDGNWVFGVEGEGYWSGIKSRYSNLDSEGFGYTNDTRNKSDFSIAARAGIAFDRTLVYGKAGWVWGRFDFSEFDTLCCSNYTNYGAFTQTYAAAGTLNGLLLGLGIEHALTQNWTLKLEYNYLRFGSKELAATGCDTYYGYLSCYPTGTTTFHADKQLFKVGVNYLFNMGKAPVVAKY